MRVALDRLPEAGRHALALLAALAADPSPSPLREEGRVRGQGLWVVGGTLRELLAGGVPADLDVAVAGGALPLGRAAAERLDAAFVVLDARRGACRIVPRGAGAGLDLTDLRASTIEGDLRARDFTVNALAVRVDALLRDGSAEVVDPTGGLEDLRARLVRVCGAEVLAEDPLRTLRGARLAMRPGWRLEAATERAIAVTASQTAGVARERIRSELVAILSDGAAGAGLRLLDRLGILAVLLPESAAMRATAQPQPHHFDVWEHSLRAVEGLDTLLTGLSALAPWTAALETHLAEDLGDGLTRREALKLAALLHDVAKPETRAEEGGRVRFLGHDGAGARRIPGIAERFRLSRRAARVVERLVAEHLRPMHLAQAGMITRRARFRFWRALGEEAYDLLLLALADAAALTGTSPLTVWAGPGGDVVRSLLAGAAEETGAAGAPPLLRGEDVMAAFGLAPGSEVGRLLAAAREAQALGLVGTREEALEHLRGLTGREGPSAPRTQGG